MCQETKVQKDQTIFFFMTVWLSNFKLSWGPLIQNVSPCDITSGSVHADIWGQVLIPADQLMQSTNQLIPAAK